MAIRVVPYRKEHEPLVRDFNARMAAAGSDWAFYDSADPGWVAPGRLPNVRREYYVALDDDDVVRAGYCLKLEEFLLRGQPFVMASIQGPVSEGLVNPAYRVLAFHLIRDMEDHCPNLFGWGASHRALELFVRLGFSQHRMPVQLRILKAGRFFRGATYLRRSTRNRRVLDALALTGAAGLGVPLAQLGLQLSVGRPALHDVEVHEQGRFGIWADEVWDAARGAYGLIARRDSATLNVLLPDKSWPEAHILQVTSKGVTLGWAAVRDTQFRNDSRFGDLRMGVIVDALAIPGSEPAVIAAASRWLRRRRVDAVVTNFTHPNWRRAFRAAGYLESANRRPLLFNPVAAEAIGDDGVITSGLHMTPLDGDGPHGF
jgi:hypothetical protein